MKPLWTGNWKLDSETVQDLSLLTISFSDHGEGTLSVKNESTGYLCSTFYATYSQEPDNTTFEFTFARGRMKGLFSIDKSRRMLLKVTDCTLAQIPTTKESECWQLARY